MKNSSSSLYPSVSPQLYQDLKRETEPLRKVRIYYRNITLPNDWSPLNSLWKAFASMNGLGSKSPGQAAWREDAHERGARTN